MKKLLFFVILMNTLLFAQNTIHIEVVHQQCSGEDLVLASDTFNEGDAFTFAGQTLPLELEPWQQYYDLFNNGRFEFPTGSVNTNVDVSIRFGSLDCDNPGLLLDPTGQGFQLFMYFAVKIIVNGEPVSVTFPAGSEPTLVLQNSQLISLLGAFGVSSVNDISFGYLDGNTFTTDGISITFGLTTTTLKLSHFSDFGGGIGNITTTDIKNDTGIPSTYSLAQNYPNPFNPTTTIRFNLPQAGNVMITVYDAIGKEMETLFDNFAEAGSHQIEWNASKYASGVYLYRMEAGNFISIKKMLLVK